MTSPTSVGLFAGIGGIELGLERQGFQTLGLAEIDEHANQVLDERFPGARRWTDVTAIKSIPKTDVLSAGFPCQDLSLAGGKRGITGSRSSLVGQVFRLLDGRSKPTWLLLENVWYMLRLDRGAGMELLATELEARGYRWAYRVVDSRAFGIPQRRQRVILLASRKEDPRPVLFSDDEGVDHLDDSVGQVDPHRAYGFYWTEGLRGLGWTRSGVPTIKGGSTVGIPSPPAVWLPDTGFFGTPSLIDVERLQGFPQGWTSAAQLGGNRNGPRWKLVGNAVSVPVAEWVGLRLLSPGDWTPRGESLRGTRWPQAAWGDGGTRRAVDVTVMPFARPFELRSFLQDDLRPLSLRAATGFRERTQRSTLRFPDGFLRSLDEHVSGTATATVA